MFSIYFLYLFSIYYIHVVIPGIVRLYVFTYHTRFFLWIFFCYFFIIGTCPRCSSRHALHIVQFNIPVLIIFTLYTYNYYMLPVSYKPSSFPPSILLPRPFLPLPSLSVFGMCFWLCSTIPNAYYPFTLFPLFFY